MFLKRVFCGRVQLGHTILPRQFVINTSGMAGEGINF